MKLELNIGRLIGRNNETLLNRAQVGAALLALFGNKALAKLHELPETKNCEPTFYVTLETDQPPTEGEITALCLMLGQQAIAGRFDGAGFLYGPKATEWGGQFIIDYWRDLTTS